MSKLSIHGWLLCRCENHIECGRSLFDKWSMLPNYVIINNRCFWPQDLIRYDSVKAQLQKLHSSIKSMDQSVS